MVNPRISTPKIRSSRFTVLLAGVFILFAAALTTAHEPSKRKIASLKRAVVVVTTFDEHGKPLLQGSGFFVAADCIVTNLHVVNNASGIRIRTFGGNSFTVQSFIAKDAVSDLALLQLEAPCLESTTLQIQEKPPNIGEAIILLSNAQGSYWKVTSGRVGRTWRLASVGRRMQITADVFPGSSGSPVLNHQGQVVGIAVMNMRSDDDLNFAVPAKSLKLLQDSVINPVRDSANHHRR